VNEGFNSFHRARTRPECDDSTAPLVERVRATIAPRPDLHYPAPWRMAEDDSKGRPTVVCADGRYACVAASNEAAEAIVLAVNTLAGVETR
jgi:hypothetical protein